MPAPVLTREPARKIDWKLAAELRARGLTWSKIADLTNASSGDAVRTGLNRRGVGVAIRTVIATTATEHARDSLAHASETTKLCLSGTVLAQAERLARTKTSPNLRNIKKIADCLEPLARTAKIVHGWGEGNVKSLVNVNVMGTVNFEDLPVSGQLLHVPDTVRSVPATVPHSEQVTDPVPGPGE